MRTAQPAQVGHVKADRISKRQIHDALSRSHERARRAPAVSDDGVFFEPNSEICGGGRRVIRKPIGRS